MIINVLHNYGPTATLTSENTADIMQLKAYPIRAYYTLLFYIIDSIGKLAAGTVPSVSDGVIKHEI